MLRTILNLLNGNKRIIALVMLGISAMIKRYPELEPVLGGLDEAQVTAALDWLGSVLGVIGVGHEVWKRKKARQ